MVIPVALLTHPELTDCDVRVLLALDLIGWREGAKDGLVRASNKEIGDRIGKGTTAVRDSIRHLESLQPPPVTRSMLNANTRDAIQLNYDRFGKVNGIPLTTPHLNIAEVSGIPLTPLQPEPEVNGIPLTHAESEPEVSGIPLTTPHLDRGGQRNSAGGVNGIPLTHPIKSKEIDQGRHQGGVNGIPVTRPQVAEAVNSTPIDIAGLTGWLPCITDDPHDLERLRKKVPVWVRRIEERCPRHAVRAAEWVQDALITACDKQDMVDYAQKMLTRWVGAGGRPDFELAAPRPEPAPDAPGVPVSYAPSPARAAVTKPTYAQRVQADRQALLDTFRQPRREATDG